MARSELKQARGLKYDGEVGLALGRSRYAKTWKNESLKWSDLIARLNAPTVTQESYAEYMKMSRSKRAEVKDVGGYVGGYLKNGKRRADRIQARSIVTLDADFATPGLWDDMKMIFSNAIAAYSTHTHSTEKPRIRVIIPLSRPVLPEEYTPIARKIAEQFGMDMFDDSTYEPERLMYWPSHSRDGDYFFEYEDARWLNPDDVLAEYDDWKDSSFWPTSSREHEVHAKEAKKQGNPLEKKGIVGAFCRTHDIKSAIETFLPDVYEPTQHEDRYTYLQGSTVAGLVLYDGIFAYSHHGTDPAGSSLNNAFDLVRKHLFGELDLDTPETMTAKRMPSYKAMLEYIQDNDPDTMKLYKKEQTEEDFAEDVDGEEVDAPSDYNWLTFNQMGNPEINSYILASQVLAENEVYYDGHQLIMYQEDKGVWLKQADEYLKSILVTKYLGELSRTRDVNETIANIKALRMNADSFEDNETRKIALGNGVYNTKDRSFSPKYDPNLHAMSRSSVDYDPEATAETFKGFVKWLVGDKAEIVYEWLGYSLLRELPIQRMLFVYGRGGAGKSTLMTIFKAIAGGGASAVPLDSLMGSQFAAADLYHKTVNIDADASPEYLNDGALIKKLSGDDVFRADVKYGQPVVFKNYAKLIFSTNYLPPMRDFSGGLKRRAMIIKLNKVVTTDVAAKYPIDKIMNELPGVLNIALKYLDKLLKDRKFLANEDIDAEVEAWVLGNNLTQRFLNDVCVIDKDATAKPDDVFDAYTQYAEECRERPAGKYKFFARLKEMEYDRARIRENGKRVYVYKGFRLQNDFDDGEELMQ